MNYALAVRDNLPLLGYPRPYDPAVELQGQEKYQVRVN